MLEGISDGLRATRMRVLLGSCAVTAFVVIVNAVLVATATAQAKDSTYAISGVAQDEDGIVIPNAHVTLVAERPEKTYSALTDARGKFRFESLASGSYHIRVEEQGFQTFEKWILISSVREFGLIATLPVIRMRQAEIMVRVKN